MLAASRSRRRSRVTVAGSLVGLALLLVGCSNPGSIDDFNSDTEDNFHLACKEANANQGLDAAELDEVCGCWYNALTEEMSFDAFQQAEDDIRLALDENRLNNDDDLRRVAPDFFDIIDESDCVQAGPQAG